MTVTPSHEEPSLEGIVSCLRRILVEEENARRRRAAPGGEPLLLSDMIRADGTIARISPDARDPFLRLDILKGRVAVLLSPENPAAAACRAARSGRRTAAQNDATPFVAPDQLAGRIQDTAADATAPSLSATAELPRASAVETPASILAPIAPAESVALSLNQAAGQPVRLDPPPGAADVLRPTNHIELMLAQQMAAAYQAVLTLTGAAIQTIHGHADDGNASEAAGRSARGRMRIRVKRDPGAKATRLANSAARMMQSYNAALTTLAMLRGAAPAAAERNTSPARRPTGLLARIRDDEGGESLPQDKFENAKRKRSSLSRRRSARGTRSTTH